MTLVGPRRPLEVSTAHFRMSSQSCVFLVSVGSLFVFLQGGACKNSGSHIATFDVPAPVRIATQWEEPMFAISLSVN